jgi:hypothetical protein
VIPLGQIVDWPTLGTVAGYALLAGFGVSIAFSLTILGATRFADSRRDNRDVRAAAYAVLGALGFAATLSSIVLGIVIMTRKG